MPVPWFERTFQFTLPEEAFPLVVERLRGAPARVEEKVKSLAHGHLTRRDQDRWSIQEHAGHLVDLDELHTQRLDDFLEGAKELRAADLGNRKTHEAGYNERSIEDILRAFRRGRESFVARLDAWPAEKLALTSLHPRLKQPMRVIDMAVFVADHDDHHLTRMTELAGRFASP